MRNAGTFTQLVAGVACLAVAYAPLAPVVWGAPAAPDAATTLANSLRAIQDGENAAPRDHWDPAYVEAQLANDPALTFAWVRDHTYWIPYHGILRGPVGVLMDRQGDSLDRALLLATMLKDEGQTVRLAHGTMPRDRAEALMPVLLSARTIRDAGPKPASLATDDLAQVAAKYQLDAASIRKTIAAQASTRAQQRRTLDARVSTQVRRLVAAAGQPPADSQRAARDRAVAALVDHWWVEIQTHGSWQPRDLLTLNTGTALASADRTLDPTAPPADLYHQVTIRVVAEQWAGGVTSEKAALEQTFRSADVIGAPISLEFTAGQSMKSFPTPGMDAAASLRANVLAQHEWTPSLYIGRQHVVQNAITDGGTLTVPSSDGDVLAVAKGVTHGLAGAIDDVFGSAPSAPAPVASSPQVLSAAWIEYAITLPGEPTRTIRRQVFDLPGPAVRAARSATWRLDDAGRLARGLALTMSTEILPINSELSPQYVAHLSRQAMLANAALATDVVGGKIADDFSGAQTLGGRFVRNGGSLYGFALHRLNQSPLAAFIYVDRPEILSRHLFVSLNGTTLKPVAATDIVANGVGVDPIESSPFTIAVEQGVYDTNGEAVLYSVKPDAGNTGWAYDNPSNWLTLTKPGDPALASLQLGNDVRQRIDAALSSNHVVVAPRARVPVGSGTFAGWWQIDKTTGETLGMGESGWGQDLPEYAVLLMIGSAFMNGWLFCELAPNSNGGTPIVASAALGAPRPHGFRDLIDPPVEASSGNCLVQAFVLTMFGMLGAAFGPGAGGTGGNFGKGGGDGIGEGGDGPGGSLPEDSVDPLGKTQPYLGKTEPDLGKTMPQGLGGSGAGAGNPGAGGGDGVPPVPEGNPGGGKYTRQQLMDYYTDTRGRLAPPGDEGQWNKEFIMRQPGVKDWVRDDLANQLGYPPGEGNQPDPPGFQQWLNRYLGGGGAGNGGGSGSSGASGGTSSAGGGDQIPPTLRSAGVGSGGTGQGGGTSGGTGTLPGLGPTTGSGGGTGTLPGLGPCAPNCGPSGSATLVGLGGAMGALGGS